MEGGLIDRLACRQRGIVGDRGQLALDQEGVADVDGEADDHEQREPEKRADEPGLVTGPHQMLLGAGLAHISTGNDGEGRGDSGLH